MRTGTPGFVAVRLTEGREARGLSQTVLADRTGIKSQSISHYEQGRQSPSPEALTALCVALDLPERFFLRTSPDLAYQPIFFRQPGTPVKTHAKLARARTVRHMIWLRTIARYLHRYVALPESRVPHFPAGDEAGPNVDEIADRVRQTFGRGLGPLVNLIPLLEENGCIVGRLPMDVASGGSCSHYDAAPHIALRLEDTRSNRMRFNAAHELGHMVMHRHLLPDLSRQLVTHAVLQAQAERFARAFLLPAATFGPEVWAPTIDALLTLKKEWRCPVSAMVSRCGEIGLFNPDQRRRAASNLVRRGWKTAEPREDAVASERPRLLARGFELLIAEGLNDRRAILKELGLGAADIEQICGLEPGYLTAGDALPQTALRLRRDAESEGTSELAGIDPPDVMVTQV